MEKNRTYPRDNETHPPIKAKYSIIVDKSKIKTVWLRLSLSDFHFRILYLNPIDNRLNGALRNNIESYIMESTKTIVVRKQPEGLAILNLLGVTIFCVAFTIAGWYDTTDMFILGLILAIAFVPASVNALCWQFFGKETFVFNGDNVDIVRNYLFFSSKQTVDYCQIQSIDVPKNRQSYANPFYGLKVLLQAFFLAGGAIELHKKGGSTITCCQGDKKNTAAIVKEFKLRCSSISLQESSPNKNSYSSYRKDYLSK